MAHAPSRRRVVRSVSQSFSISKEGVSLWSATSKEPSIPALDKNIDADVCIVGAGIAGMTTAYLLAREGKSVVILDKSQIGSGETAHTYRTSFKCHRCRLSRNRTPSRRKRRSIGRAKSHRSDCPN